MAEHSTVEVENATVVLSGPTDPFSDGQSTGYLEFDDAAPTSLFPDQSHGL
jgi:hypothetical protein